MKLLRLSVIPYCCVPIVVVVVDVADDVDDGRGMKSGSRRHGCSIITVSLVEFVEVVIVVEGRKKYWECVMERVACCMANLANCDS